MCIIRALQLVTIMVVLTFVLALKGPSLRGGGSADEQQIKQIDNDIYYDGIGGAGDSTDGRIYDSVDSRDSSSVYYYNSQSFSEEDDSADEHSRSLYSSYSPNNYNLYDIIIIHKINAQKC